MEEAFRILTDDNILRDARLKLLSTFDRMFDQLGLTVVLEAGGEALHYSRPPFDFPKQQSAAVGGNIAAIKMRHDFART